MYLTPAPRSYEKERGDSEGFLIYLMKSSQKLGICNYLEN